MSGKMIGRSALAAITGAMVANAADPCEANNEALRTALGDCAA